MANWRDRIVRAVGDAVFFRHSPAPAPTPNNNNEAEALRGAVLALCDAVDALTERVGVLESHDALAQEIARWAHELDREHPCSGSSCWWCRRRDELAARVAAAPAKPRKGKRVRK